jgi:hypothetical protein
LIDVVTVDPLPRFRTVPGRFHPGLTGIRVTVYLPGYNGVISQFIISIL